jgi:hypothetical protein
MLTSLRMTALIGERVYLGYEVGKNIMDFEVNGNTYFVDLADERGWEVLVATPNGARAIPVYDDGIENEDITIVVQDERKRKILN